MRKASSSILHISKTLAVLAITLFLFPQAGNAQHFWNTDFEYAGYESQPRKWSIEGEGVSYSAGLDSTTRKSGNKSLHLSLTNAEVYAILSVPAELIAGKTLQAEGYIQHDSLNSLQTMLIFHNPAEGTTDSGQPGTSAGDKWAPVSLEASFPQNYSSDRLLIALVASGSGRFWFDDVRITIDGREYGHGEPDFREPTSGEVERLNKRAVPIHTTEADAVTKDLEPLSGMVGSARIVALGENSHGSSSIFRLKHRLVRYFVEQKGFSIFALEMPAVEADYINEYVLHGKGTIDDVLAWLTYPSWQTQEIIDLI